MTSELTAADRAEIREVLSEYCFRMDDGDYRGVASLFTPDGEWVANYEEARGREEIAALLDRINPEKGVGPFRKHIVTNSVISGTADSARSRASYLVLMAIDGRPAPIVVGTYDDEFIKETGTNAWLIARRILIHEIAGDLALRLTDQP
jgi:uncharacterized protein (TIGR02246 family)